MPLQSGSKLGPYEIVASLGAGGMGEVYRARDPRLGRDVAIKILPSSYSNDQDRLRRFEQEARATSILNHPNILAVHDLGTENGSPFLVSELLEGETLREKVRDGAIPVRKAIEYGLQIAQGLSAAHDKGIVHRDLKPENIFVTKDGRVKILDFGLAKLTRPEIASEEVSKLQTAVPESQPGVVLGTMGYMSPEQVRGKPSDHRSDIFTFGAILYEMISGKRAFHGDTAADTMGAILQKDPSELTDSNPNLPPVLNRIIRHALEKNPEERFQSMRDVAFDLETVTGLSGTQPARALIATSKRQLVSLVHLIATLLFALAAVYFALQYFGRTTVSQPAIRFSLDLPVQFGATDNSLFATTQMAISPDGLQLVFAAPYTSAQNVLWIRRMDSVNPEPLSGTDEASYPFWSPDNRFIGFFTTGKLKKIDVRSHAVQVICDAPTGRGGTWSPDGTIIFSPDKLGGIYRVPAEGGDVTAVTDDPAAQGISYRWPQFLPDYDHFLFLAQYPDLASNAVFVASLKSKDKKQIVKANSNIGFVPSGYVVYYQEGKLMAQRFDWKEKNTLGEPISIISERISFNLARGFAAFSISSSGVLAFGPDNVTASPLVWLDRTGKQIDTAGELAYYINPRISPDGKRIAVMRNDVHAEAGDIWLYDMDRKNMSRLTFKSSQYNYPTWTADGTKIIYGTTLGELSQRASNGAGGVTVLFNSQISKSPTDASGDGKFVAMTLDNAKTQQDLWIMPLTGGGKPFPFFDSIYNENGGQFSPDSRWLAYQSDESGKSQIYVTLLADKERGKWQISTAGGVLPRWRRDGKELFYISGEKNTLMSVEIKARKTFEFGIPKPLFQMPSSTIADNSLYDVSTDGQRFIVTSPPGRMYPSTVTVVVNWMTALNNEITK